MKMVNSLTGPTKKCLMSSNQKTKKEPRLVFGVILEKPTKNGKSFTLTKPRRLPLKV